MEKSYIASIVICSVVLITTLTLGIVFSQKKGGTPSVTPLTPQQQCQANGYIWNPVTNTCTSLSCTATVDSNTGKLTGQVLNFDGTQCVDVQSGAYLSPFAKASLLNLCTSTNCSNCPAGATTFATLNLTPQGPTCGFEAGCNSKPFTDRSIMDGCPYLTYQPDPSNPDNCVAPTSTELEQLCNVSVNGCPVDSGLNNNCDSSTPCFNPISGQCSPQQTAPGCRPMNQYWKWTNGQCVNTTVNNTLVINSVTEATTASVAGTFSLGNSLPLPPTSRSIYNFVLTDQNASSWQGPVTVVNNTSFKAALNGPKVSTPYFLSIQVYVSANEGAPYVLTYTNVTPYPITLTAPPVAPGLQTIAPTLSLKLAQEVAADWGTALNSANSNSGTNTFQVPASNVWNNTLPYSSTANYLLVPCTDIYCTTDVAAKYALLIMAWPVVATLSPTQLAEVQKTCPTLTQPQVSYAVYLQETSAPNSTLTVVGNQITNGSWLQPILSDPSKTWLFRIVAYVWSGAPPGGDPGVQGATCLSQPLDITIQVPPNLYNVDLCYSIQPLKPQGTFIPGNFMLYHPGSNLCSSPQNAIEALGARDFSCMVQNGTVPTLENMNLYGCNDVGYNSNCNSSGQGCLPVEPVTNVRQPTSTQTSCAPPSGNENIPCGGYQYCQEAACNCPESIEWENCGNTAYAQVGTNAAIGEAQWKDRVTNVTNFITFYGLNNLNPSLNANVQQFLNTTTTPQSIGNAWDLTYGSLQCPLTKGQWSSQQNCDASDATKGCTQSTVCGPWLPEAGSVYRYKQENVQLPSQDQSCCGTGSMFVNGCCCPGTDSQDSCAALKGCQPVQGALTKMWCQY
jgi:hypothetical protein